jgi:hypothetical protein
MSVFSSLLVGQSSREIGRLLKGVIQKQINQELTDTDTNNAEVQIPVKLSHTKDLSLVGDMGAQAKFDIATELSNLHYMTFEPDGVDLRLWLKFQNGGRLVDYAKQNLLAYSVGESNLPGTFIQYDSELNIKYRVYSYFNGTSHFAFVRDNPMVQIKNIVVDSAKNFALFMQMKPISLTQSLFTENITVASKIDDDQLRYAYAVTLTQEGHLHFYIRNDYVQYHLFVKDAYSWIFSDPIYTLNNSFNKHNFNVKNFQTSYTYLCTIARSPDLHFEDWVFNYKPATNQQYVIFDGHTLLADSTAVVQKPYMNLPLQDGKWTHSSIVNWNTTIRDSSGNGKNGTVSGQYGWNTDNALFNPGSNGAGTTGGMEVQFASNATLNTLTEFTVAIWYFPFNSATNTQSYSGKIISKGVNTNGSFWVEHVNGSDKIRANIRTNAGATTSVTATTPVFAGEWNLIVFRWKSGENLKLTINNDPEVLSASTLSTTITNSTDNLKLQSISQSLMCEFALFKLYTVQISDETLDDIQIEGYHNPLFPTAQSIQPLPDPAPSPVTLPFSEIYFATLPSSVTTADYRYINALGGDNLYFLVYQGPDGTSVVDPVTQRYSVGTGAVIPGTPVSEEIEVPSEDNSANILQKTATTNEIAGLKIVAFSYVNMLMGDSIQNDNSITGNKSPKDILFGIGATDKFGVTATYGTGAVKYDPIEDFKPGSHRWDFEINNSTQFVSCELIGYFQIDDDIDDEVTGILGGGGHSDGSTPKSYAIGVSTTDGGTRYRTELNHPTYQVGADGQAFGVPLSSNYVGYKFIKWNKPNGVLLEVWQDAGNNQGSTPANQWVRLGSWLVTNPNWQIPPSDHLETLRIDGSDSALNTIGAKWLSLREIKTTDTDVEPEPDPDPGGGGGGTPVLVSNPGIGTDLLGKVIKKAEFWMQGGSSPIGTGYCMIWDASNNVVATMGSFSASGLNQNDFEHMTFTNNSNTVPMQDGYTIGIEYNTGSSADYIRLQRRSINYDSSITQTSKKYQGEWGTNDAFEIKCVLTYTYLTPDIDPWFTMGSTPADIGSLGEVFNTGSPMIGITPTHIEYRVYRDTSVGAGTVNLDHVSSTGVVKATLKSIAASSLPTTEPTTFNYVWENFNYNTPIAAGDRLVLTVNGVGTNAIYVISNSAPTVQNYDGTRSHLIYKDNTTGWVTETGIDISGNIASGGNSFEAFERFTPTKNYIGEKIVNANSVLHNRRITRVLVRGRKVGTPTGSIICGIMDVNYNVKVIINELDVTTITAAGSDPYENVVFSNPSSSYITKDGDRIFLKYDNATLTNTVELNTGRDFVDQLDSILFVVDDGTTIDKGNKDMAGIVFIGGDLDTNSRSRVVQSIENPNSGLKGRAITKVIQYMYRTSSITSGTITCRVRRGTDDSIAATIGTADASILSTTASAPTPVVFTNLTNQYVTTLGDKISIEYDVGNTTNHVGVLVRDITLNNPFIVVNSWIKKYNGVSYVDPETKMNLVGNMYIGGYTYTPEPNAPPEPTPVADKDLVFCAGRNKASGFFEAIVSEARIYSKEITLDLAGNLFDNKYTINSIGPNEVLLAFNFKPSGP